MLQDPSAHQRLNKTGFWGPVHLESRTNPSDVGVALCDLHGPVSARFRYFVHLEMVLFSLHLVFYDCWIFSDSVNSIDTSLWLSHGRYARASVSEFS